MDETERDVLAHLHANPRTTTADLAAGLGLPEPAIIAAVAALEDAGHLERDGDALVPDGASRPTPGLFIANERADAGSVEVDLSEDER